MNKSELIEALAAASGIANQEAAAVTRTVLEAMGDALSNDENIEFRGLGSFTIKTYDSYWGRNPKTGEQIRVAPKRLPLFKAGKELRQKLNPS
ncbi:MAG: HU family DNA-binding protein [Desulfurivibrio sp.]|nr:HU family DNA-binding protein [Desulfurivibrio sp.]